MNNEYYMKRALELAEKAFDAGEVPVGCVIVSPDGDIIGCGRNMREEKKSAVSHAEIEAIETACRKTGDWRLSGCSMFVTLEPCPMCAGAVIGAQLGRVVYGGKDPSMGAMGSVVRLQSYPLGAAPVVCGGVLGDECSGLLRSFFAELRKRRRER